jgi:hypothetical protein
LFWLGALVALLGMVWLAWTMERNGVRDAMMARFEAEPAEGFAYWEAAEWRSRIPGLAMCGCIFALLAFLIIRKLVQAGAAIAPRHPRPSKKATI